MRVYRLELWQHAIDAYRAGEGAIWQLGGQFDVAKNTVDYRLRRSYRNEVADSMGVPSRPSWSRNNGSQ